MVLDNRFFDYLIRKSPPQGIFSPSENEFFRNDQKFRKKNFQETYNKDEH